MAINDPFQRLRAALGEAGPGSSDFDLNPAMTLPAGRKLRQAAVLIGFQPNGPGSARLLLTKRSSRLIHHPGQIAFPGGKLDEGDDGPVGAALREASEEVGLPPEMVDVLGVLPPHETVTGYSITPVLARITGAFDPAPEAGEVEEVFFVPFAHVTEPACYIVESRRWQGQQRHYYAIPYGPYYIWGATARILRRIADRVAASDAA